MDKQDFQDLKERLAEFAKKAAKEAHDDKDIQKLAEGCIWIGAVWLARACNINIGVKIVTIDEILELPEVKELIDKCNALGEEIKELKEKCRKLKED